MRNARAGPAHGKDFAWQISWTNGKAFGTSHHRNRQRQLWQAPMARQHDKRPCSASQRLRQTVAWRIPDFGVPSLASCAGPLTERSEEHTSELQSLMRISYAVFCLKKKKSANSN